jgi:hypothetical protein
MAALKDFSTWAAVGTFLVYLFGYLALRFHMTALGLVTELGAFDERYLFAGAHFLVFLAALLPVAAIVVLPAGALGWLVWRRTPRIRQPVRAAAQNAPLLLWASATLAVVLIQWRMNACLTLNDLPLAEGKPQPAWLFDLVRRHDTIDLSLFFLQLLFYAALVTAPVIAASRLPLVTVWLKALFAAAAILALISVLLIPVNFGLVVMPYSMERAAAIGKTPLAAGQKAWLLWEGKEWMTYFVQSESGRSLVSVPAKEIDRIEVRGSDSLFDVLYGSPGPGR